MDCLACLKILGEVRIKECNSEEDARQWLREEISDEAHFMPYYKWGKKWAIYPLAGFVIKSEANKLP